LAVVHIRAGRVDNPDPGSDIPGMISSIFAGILAIFTANDAVDVGHKIISGLNTTAKIIEKTEKNEWKASLHEEGYQITKDSILKMGGLK